MTDSRDATQRDERQWAVAGAFLCGLAAGAALAILFAPARGQETRERLLARAREGRDRLARHAYVSRLEGELDAWGATIDALKARIGQAAGDVRGEYESRLAEIRARLDAARSTLERLRSGGEAAWHELESGVDRAWGELRTAVERAVSEPR